MTVWELWGVTSAGQLNIIHDELIHDMLQGIICGAIAGIIAKTVVAPAERIKMSFQVSSEPFSFYSAYTKTINVVKTGGLISLWRGHSTTILRVAPYAGFSYAIHDVSENSFKRIIGEPLPYSYKFLAGSLGGIGGTLLTYPLDVLRVRLALIPSSTFSSSIKQGGLFHGLVPTILGIIPYAGTTWCVKQTLQEQYVDIYHMKQNSFLQLVTNAFAGLCGQLVTYPLDIIRRRMQMNIDAQGTNRSVRAVISSIIQLEGYKGLTKGFSINIVKGPLTLSISLTTFDLLKRWSDELEGRRKWPSKSPRKPIDS